MASELLFKISWVILVYILAIGQYKLWFSEESIITYWQLQESITEQTNLNIAKQEINKTLYAEVANLKQGLSALEERARNDLGLIRDGEQYYQIIEKE